MPESHVKFHSTNGKRLVLSVDDEPANQMIVGAMLESSYEVIYADSGTEALEQAAKYKDVLSVILLDLILPDINGLDVLRQLKKDPALSAIPVIVMSSDTKSELESLTIGAIDFIPKPYPNPALVLARILRIIELSEDRDIIHWTERDHLTGLFNLDYFNRYVSNFDTFHPDMSMDAIIVDINHFHMINERYGKAYGDEILKRIATVIRKMIPDSDGFISRPNADTFMIYCRHQDNYQSMLDQISSGLSGHPDTKNKIRLRMGVYSNVDKSLEIGRRFDRAKAAANTIRGSFTKSIGHYDNAMHDSEMYSEQLLDDFDEAIHQKQFVVYYQPKFDVRPDIPVLSSAEALVRWNHPTLGMISPGIFIPLFESNGLIERLDNYVWNETAAQIRDWHDRLGISVPVSVNVSRIDMYNPDIVPCLVGIVEKYNLTQEDLILEITESAYTQDSVQIIDTVNRLRKVGFRIEMDDFGTGYSSLNMISSLPLDALKLDMQFIRNAFSERKDTRMLEVILEIASILAVPTVAEGVETAEQMFTLKTMGCDIIQGYYFSRPVPARELDHFLLDRKDAPLQDYNDPFTRCKKFPGSQRTLSKDPFTYDALHDPVTGLYNGSAFEVLLKDADHDHIALLILDILDYDLLEEQLPHNTLDRLAIHISDVLRRNFRSVDYLCRIRNDEFVVILTRVVSSQKALIAEKIQMINEVLSQPSSDLPAVSLVVGAAFSDREDPDGDIFQDADTALIRIKTARKMRV